LAVAGAVLGSLALHGAVLLALRWIGTLPDVGFELELPSQVELGVMDGASLPAAALPPPSDVAPPPPGPPTPAVTPSEPGPTPKPPTPPKPKPKKKPKPVESADAGTTQTQDAGATGSDKPATPLLAAYAPKGAQLALRVDLDRVRDSPLADDTRSLLQAIPDFQMILDGSGVDPLADLSRLFLASPNLQRESLVMAGKYVGDEDVPRRAADKLAASRGKTVKWRKQGGIAVAPWENVDTTPRVLALLAPSLFAITRSEDLPRILGVARALAARAAKEKREHATPEEIDPAQALLAMGDNEVVAFSVENAKSFARGKTEHVPDRVEISIRLLDQQIEVHTLGVFADSAEAGSALDFWTETQRRYARHPLVALVGMAVPLRETTLATNGERLEAVTHFSLEDAKRILQFVRDAISRPRQ
jgi:hypothetical protein